jgi:Zn-finger in ubiquitin-hydrolases and other protein
MNDNGICSHINHITKIKTSETHVCSECIKHHTQWVHLRICQTCGLTLCCDQSPEQHMTKHHHASGHPVVASAQPGERWLYCYPDDQMAEY